MRSAFTLFLLLSLAITVAAAPKPLSPYQTLVLEPFTVDPELVKAKFPANYESVLQKTLYATLLSDRVFETVTDASLDSTTEGCRTLPQRGGCERTLIATGQIVDYYKGNRAARVIINYGAGSARLKIVMTFRDAQTGKEVLRIENEGSYAGFGNLTGGSAEKARNESARKAVEGLIKKIKAAR